MSQQITVNAAPPARLQNDSEDEPEPLLVLRPTSGWSAIQLGELWAFRDLLLTLAERDIKLRYRQTALGVIWVLLQPLLAAGIFSFVFGKVAKMPSDGVPYFIFSYAGLLGWNAFSGALGKVSSCLTGNAHLISKVYFPRLVLPLSTLGSTLLDFCVAFGMMALLMALNGVVPHLGLVLLPLWVAIFLMIAVGLGLYAAALMVSYRDVQYIVPVGIQLLLYASPVAYPVSAVPKELQSYYLLNPLSGLLEAFRWSLLGRGELSWGWVGYSGILGLVILVGGTVSFKQMERKFADVI